MSICYVVATPIGHLDDFSIRAINTLKSVDYILAEDSRHSQTLLNHYQISKKVIAFHEHNEAQKTNWVLTKIKANKSFALISDAGTPLISDPGFLLISKLKKENITVVPIPGCNAAITALSASGLPCHQFYFVGFLSHKGQKRLNQLTALSQKNTTLIFYESPKRIVALLSDIHAVFGANISVCLAKELTKKFETIRRQNATSLIDWLLETPEHQKGEFVVLIDNNQDVSTAEAHLTHVLNCLQKKMTITDAAKMAAAITGISKNKCYQHALKQ